MTAGRSRWTAVTVLIALAALLAAGVLAWLLLEDTAAVGRTRGTTPGSSGAVVESRSAKASALAAAEEAATRVLSYSHRSLDDDIAAARVLLGGEMLEQYDTAMAGIRPEAEKSRRQVRATVVAASIISATERHAKALLFVNTETRETRQAAAGRPRTELNRVIVTLRRDADDWLVTALDSL